MTMRLRSRTPKSRTRPPFHPVETFVLRDAELVAYWREYRAEWTEWHQSRHGASSMPQQYWRELGILTEDRGPIDWRDWLDEDAEYHYRLGHVGDATLVELARAARLAADRAAWLEDHT